MREGRVKGWVLGAGERRKKRGKTAMPLGKPIEG